MKKLISLLIVVMMVFATFSSAIHISAETVSGTCGDNLTWSLDSTTGVLTISGTGEMNDFGYSDNKAPWYTKRDLITSVELSDDVTSIGSYAFHDCNLLNRSVLIFVRHWRA